MKNASTMPINGEKLRELVLNKGYISVISEELGYSNTALGIAIKKNKITKPMISLLDSMCGIKYEDYKPEEPKPEPKEEPKPVPETVITDKYEQHLKAILFQLANVNNNLVALAKIIAKIDEDIKVWECDD